MKRFALPLTLVATLTIVVGLFHLKQRVRDLEQELSQVNHMIVTHQETIQVLNSEWSFLNEPGAVQDLATDLLHMRPNTTAQVIRLKDLPMRQTATRPISADLNVTASELVERTGAKKGAAQ